MEIFKKKKRFYRSVKLWDHSHIKIFEMVYKEIEIRISSKKMRGKLLMATKSDLTGSTLDRLLRLQDRVN